MADTKQAPLASVPMFSVPSIDLSKVNPTGVGTDPNISQDYKTLLEAQKRYADELEQRYAQPNLFKVAAGFAKPQLGGFLASLGSASEAMGEQEELRRAIAPTVAQMRAEIARGNIALGQGVKAAGILEKAGTAGRLPTATETADVAALTGGPGGAAAAGQAMASAQTNELVTMLAEGRNYTDITSRLPKAFVDANIGAILRMNPQLKPPAGMPGSAASAAPAASGEPAAAGAPAAPAQAGPTIPGVPAALTQGLPLARQLAAQSDVVAAMQVERDKLNTGLTQQATNAVPIFEVATNLYKAAANPSLSVAFGVFERGDPLSIIGKAVESGSFPAVIEKMRTYITQSRLGADQKKRAISDLQALEGTLADLQTKMQNGVINPTDVRTMFESESIPNVRNTQDAFLRGIARIGSDALSRYETKKAFDKALQDPNFNVQSWASSPYFSSVAENAKKRTQALITNPASFTMPRFMQQGLAGAYDYRPQRAAAPTTSTSTSRSRTSDFEAEARRRGLIQ